MAKLSYNLSLSLYSTFSMQYSQACVLVADVFDQILIGKLLERLNQSRKKHPKLRKETDHEKQREYIILSPKN